MRQLVKHLSKSVLRVAIPDCCIRIVCQQLDPAFHTTISAPLAGKIELYGNLALSVKLNALNIL